jgi:hypothetical protein
MVLHVLVGILDHDDGTVHHGADGDGDAAQAHDVGVDPLTMHDDKADQDTHRQCKNNHQRAAEVKEKNNAHDGHDDAFLDQGAFKIVHCTQDQP